MKDLHWYCRYQVLDRKYFGKWNEICGVSRERLKKEGLTEDNDKALFNKYVDESWDEYTDKYVGELYEKAKEIVFYNDWHSGDIKFVSDWAMSFRKPKSEEYVFEMFYSIEDYANYLEDLDTVGTVKCCFYEDTISFTEEEIKAVLRKRGVWKTAWQWLAQDKKKVKDKSVPKEFYELICRRDMGEFIKSSRSLYHYSQYDTVEVSKEEYEELKNKYIAKFGSWEKIDLEHTEYNGKKWY